MNLILVTSDGVRWQELQDRRLLPNTWRYIANSGLAVGVEGSHFFASHPSLTSLPCYQTLLTGKLANGDHNDLGPIEVDSILDRVKEGLGLSSLEVAAFASWKKLDRAVSQNKTGFHRDIYCGEQHEDLPPWDECRWDKETFVRAFDYLREHRPRFLYLSLADTDDWAHTGSFECYEDAVKNLDRYLTRLIEISSEDTLLLFTTDHGRGEGEHWHDHGPHTPEASRILLLAWRKNGFGLSQPEGEYSHLDLFPAIESYFGLREPNALGKLLQPQFH